MFWSIWRAMTGRSSPSTTSLRRSGTVPAVSDSSVYLAIRQLRQALADGDEGTRYIETIPKPGYRLAVPVERLERVERVGPEPIPAHEHAASDEPVRREGARHWKSPALLAGVAATLVVVVAIVAATVTFRNNARSVTTQSVAVLPFDNLSSDPEQEYFADGITLETLNTLSRVHDLCVTAPTSSFRFKEKLESASRRRGAGRRSRAPGQRAHGGRSCAHHRPVEPRTNRRSSLV